LSNNILKFVKCAKEFHQIVYIMKSEFRHYDLKLVAPDFNSGLTDLIIELNHLRHQTFEGTTDIHIFNSIKKIFHTLESVGSARIEGNNTTVAEYIEAISDKQTRYNNSITEIRNVERGIDFIDSTLKTKINKLYISELHKIVTEGITPGEGEKFTPGSYRKSSVKIFNAKHTPPDFTQVNDYMDELIEFINSPDAAKYDLLKTAIAHHRFVWIHPYSDGNGRTARLLTYAMLVKQGFNLAEGKIINPTAVFCSDRNRYYENLSKADSGKPADILHWCEYVLGGLKNEIEKINRLLNYEYLLKNILQPTLQDALDYNLITADEFQSLWHPLVSDIQIFSAKDIHAGYKKLSNVKPKHPSVISRMIRELLNKNLLIQTSPGSRKYLINFENKFLHRSLMKILAVKGFLPDNL
jgi:Fic family protein